MTTLGIFVKQPIPGRVKTRLGELIGNARAASLYATFQRDLMTRTAGIARRRVLAYSPDTDEARSFFEQWTADVSELWPQPEADLGTRLSSFFKTMLSHENGPVVAIGSDSPSLPIPFILQAFELLEGNDSVLGPAMDGGYYLIGLRSFIPEIFQNIAWSTAGVLAQTVAHLEAGRHSLALLPPWYDVDTLDDLRFCAGHLDALNQAGQLNDIPKQSYRELKAVLKSAEAPQP